MSTHKQVPLTDELANLGYDTSDVAIGSVNKAMWMFFIATALFIVAALVIQYFLAGEVGPKQAVSRQKLPAEPYPLLQTNVTAVEDMRQLRQREIKGLTSYQWLDRNRGIAQIPIERAIELKAAQMAAAPIQGAHR